MELSLLHEVKHGLEELAGLIEVFVGTLRLYYRSAHSFAHIQEIVEHDQPELTEYRSEFFNLCWELFLSLEKNKAKLDGEVRDNGELVLFTVYLEGWRELNRLRVQHAQNVLQEVPKVFAS